MTGLEIGHILEEITPLRVVWAGLGIVTVCLSLMLVTRWGDSKPVAKCLVLSLLAHCLLALYGTTVVVALGAQTNEKEIVFNLERIEHAEPGADAPVPDVPPARLLDTFVHRAEIESSPLELPRPEADVDESPVRTPNEPAAPIAPRTPQVQVPLESPEQPQPGQATRSDVQPEPVVVSNTLEPDVSAPEARRPAETPLPGPRQTEVRNLDDEPDVARSRPSDEAPPPLTEESASRPPRAEPSPLVVPKAVLADDQDLTSRRGRPAEAAPLAPESAGGDNGATRDESSRPAFAASPSLTQRPGLGQRADDGPQRSRPAPGALSLPQPDPRLSVPAGPLRTEPPLAALTPGTPDPTEDSLRFRERLKRVAVYRFRMAPNRSQLAAERGGSRESEQAVEDALAWLAAHQTPEGRWDADGFHRRCPKDDRCDGPAGIEEQAEGHDRESVGGKADTGVTGLALLAYLGAGYTHQSDRYAENVQKALAWLIAQQTPGGSLAGEAAAYAHLYCHAMATIAVCEAYGMTGDPALRAPAEAAIDYIVKAQHPTKGGWRYGPRQLGDTSSTGWQIMALKSAALAGIEVPQPTYDLGGRFLDSVTSGRSGGLASYRPGEAVKVSMTAEALFTRQLLGLDRDDAASNEAGDYLLARLPTAKSPNLYYWYYGTLSMYQLGGRYWRDWNDALRDTLIGDQRREGHPRGSWDPVRPWGGYGGRVYSTALSVLCLEVYYRFLPLYNTSGQVDEARPGGGS